MSKADKMFEKLGYTKEYDGRYPKYVKENVTLMFDIDDETYSISEYCGSHNRTNAVYIDDRLHQAMHEKMKELGWLDE